jgi:hypothetical protein
MDPWCDLFRTRKGRDDVLPRSRIRWRAEETSFEYGDDWLARIELQGK